MTLSMGDRDVSTREELIFQLQAGDAHQTFLDAVADFPSDAINVRPANTGYSFWHLVEHVRYCQWDMLDYLRNPQYRAGVFPEDYWPGLETDASEQQWVDSVESFRGDLSAVEAFVRDADTDLWVAAPQAWEPAHTPLRTVMVTIDHNAYHGGEMGILRQVMGLWAPDRQDTFTIAAEHTQNRP
jgi:DinB superfamily